jgi:hypothetical protein
MAIYRELTTIRTEIERLTAQLRLLDQQVALSTIEITLTPDAGARPVIERVWRPFQTARSSVRTLFRVLQWMVDFAIIAVIVIAPVLLILGLLLFLFMRAVRSRRGKSGMPPGS